MALFMPEIPEAYYPIEAFHRMGVVYTSLPTSLGDQQISDRIHNLGVKYLFTVNAGWHNEKAVFYKEELLDYRLLGARDFLRIIHQFSPPEIVRKLDDPQAGARVDAGDEAAISRVFPTRKDQNPYAGSFVGLCNYPSLARLTYAVAEARGLERGKTP